MLMNFLLRLIRKKEDPSDDPAVRQALQSSNVVLERNAQLRAALAELHRLERPTRRNGRAT